MIYNAMIEKSMERARICDFWKVR